MKNIALLSLLVLALAGCSPRYVYVQGRILNRAWQCTFKGVSQANTLYIDLSDITLNVKSTFSEYVCGLDSSITSSDAGYCNTVNPTATFYDDGRLVIAADPTDSTSTERETTYDITDTGMTVVAPATPSIPGNLTCK